MMYTCVLEGGKMSIYACISWTMVDMCPSCRQYDEKPAHMRGDSHSLAIPPEGIHTAWYVLTCLYHGLYHMHAYV